MGIPETAATTGAAAGTAPAAGVAVPAVETGLARLVREGFAAVRGRAVAVLTHPAAILPDAAHAVDVLLAGGVDVTLLMGAEHGVRGSAQAGLSETAPADPATGLPVLDTYGLGPDAPAERLAEQLAQRLAASGVETVLVDLQHSGARFYTYESTLHDVIRAAALTGGIRVLVLDRPNPLGGRCVAGPMLDPGYASFVGRSPIPVRHGMTMGELARLFAARVGAPEPDVVPMRGWRRAMLFPETALPWVAPSPNLPTPASALCYPGTCLFEGTDVSVGRGTSTPFELLGAPWMDGSWARDLRAAPLAGVVFREAYFAPVADLHASAMCCGVQLHVTDPHAFDPLRTAVWMLECAQRRWPERMGWRERSFDLLAGSARLREAVTAGQGADDIVEGWHTGIAGFRAERDRFLLY